MFGKRSLLAVLCLIVLATLCVGCNKLTEYYLLVDTVGNGSVNIAPNAEKYAKGAAVTLTAVAESGWQFSHWQGDIGGTEAKIELTMNADKEVTAIFVRQDYALTIDTQGEGTVNKTVLSTPTSAYPYETVLELTAVAESGWQFSHWQGDATGNNPKVSITLDADKQVTAVFIQLDRKLTVNTQGQGTVVRSVVDIFSDEYPHDTIIRLNAIADTGWRFSHWEGDIEGTETETYITMDSDKEITAVFEIQRYSLDINVIGRGSVNMVTIESQETDYPYGTEITLKALPEEGWGFSRWEGDVGGSEQEISFVMDDNKEITVYFLELFSITIAIEGEGSVLMEPEMDLYLDGTEVTLTAMPAIGWALVAWEGLDENEHEEEIVIIVEENINLGVEFKKLYAGGLGTEADPFIIETAEHLDNVRYELDSHFLQTQDIDLSSYANWNPIGLWYEYLNPNNRGFKGVYDGDEHVIDNLIIDVTYAGVGLFAYVESEGELKNIKLPDLSVIGGEKTGGLVGFNEGKITNCHVSGTATVYTGAPYHLGLLVGLNENGKIFDCTADGIVTGNQSIHMIGGLVGRNQWGEITNCYFSGTVEGFSNSVGGLTGYTEGGTITFCEVDADIYKSGASGAGLLADSCSGTLVKNCHTRGTITGGSNCGGLISILWRGEVIDCSADVDVWGSKIRTGGLVGLLKYDGVIRNSYATGNVTGEVSETGGLVGKSEGTIINCYATGNVTSDDKNTGGLVGQNLGSSSYPGTILSSYATGTVNGQIGSGGLVGQNLNGTIENCYALGEVTGTYEVGGLVGLNEGGTVSNSYATGHVTGDQIATGGLIGASTGSKALIEYSYYDQETTGQDDEGKGIPVPTNRMYMKATFEPEWDFESIWDIIEGMSYPFLRWQPTV